MMDIKIYAYVGAAWTEITDDVQANPGVICRAGISGSSPVDIMARIGMLTFELKNPSYQYSPGVSAFSSDWGIGTPIKVEFTKNVTRTKLIGRIPAGGIELINDSMPERRVGVTVVDWMHDASKLPLDIPALQTDKRADEIITTIVGFSPIQPEAMDLQTGVSTFPYAFHDNTVKTTAYSEITKAVTSEWGHAYVKLDGTLVFEAYEGRTNTPKDIDAVELSSGWLLLEDGTDFLLENGTNLLLEDYTSTSVSPASLSDSELISKEILYGKQIINRASVSVYPYKPGEEDVIVYTNEINQYIPAGATVKFRIQFKDPDSLLPISAISPAVKQYTLLHFEDNSSDGISGVLDDADLNTKRLSADGFYSPTTPFSASGGSYSSGKFGDGFAGNGSSDYVYSVTQEKFNFRADDFTVSWWEYRNSATAGAATISRSTTAAFSPYVFGYSDGATARVFITSNGASWDIANSKSLGTITTGSWVHYEVTRNGSTFRTFKNGVQQDTWTSSATILASSDDFSILRYNGSYMYGIIDELRMIKGYAEHTADFTPPARKYSISGINWSVYTGEKKTGTELTSSMTVTVSSGGAGLDFTVVSSSASNGYLSLDIYAPPLESLTPISHINEDTTSVNNYGYISEHIDMRLRDDIVFAKTIVDEIIARWKDPAYTVNKVSYITKNSYLEALFLETDIGDFMPIEDVTSYGLTKNTNIQYIEWRATPSVNGAIVNCSYTLKEQ